MDIRKGGKYPSGALSNFQPYVFHVDDVLCNSMEGFLQGLKFSSVEMQEYVCTLTGAVAKKKGANKNWRKAQTLYWKGIEYKRDSVGYQQLLDKAFNALNTNVKFRKALSATNNAALKHSLGKRKSNETVLTQREFCSRLLTLREKGEI